MASTQEATTRPISLQDELVVRTQWRIWPQTSDLFPTFEVYLDNESPKAIQFKTIALDGGDPIPVQNNDVTWWQFYPSPTIPPGGACVLQINFTKWPSSTKQLQLTAADGRTLKTTIGPIDLPSRRLWAVTYEENLSRFYVQWISSYSKPRSIRINNRPAVPLATLVPTNRELEPETLVFAASEPLKPGDVLHISADFEPTETSESSFDHLDGLVRIMPGIVLDSYGASDQAARQKLGLDMNPMARVVSALGGDVACNDTKKRRAGDAAPAVIADRLRLYSESPQQLTGPHICTGVSNSTYPIYGPIGDVTYANPYAIHFLPDLSNYIQREFAGFTDRIDCARPRPSIYIPETFFMNDRLIEPGELELFLFGALSRGVKGINYFIYDDPKMGFIKSPELMRVIPQINEKIRRLRGDLSPLMYVGRKRIGDRDSGIEIAESWIGDRAVLLFVRNLKIVSDQKPNDGGRSPRFKPSVKKDFSFEYELPPWAQPELASSCDFLSKEPLAVHAAGPRKVSVQLPQLEAFRWVYIPCRPDPATLSPRK